MNFGFRIGDLTAVLEYANKLQGCLVGAPAEFKAITNELKSLSFVIQGLEVDLSRKKLTGQQSIELNRIVASCHKMLTQTETTLETYRDSGPRSDAPNGAVKSVWKRPAAEPYDVRDLRIRLSGSVGFLNAFNTRTVPDCVKRLVQQHNKDQESESLLDWLSPATHAAKQSDYSSRYEPGTGTWLLDSPEFRGWLATPTQTLFCPGMPGVGKTVLSSVIVEEIYSRQAFYSQYGHDDGRVGISYLYLSYQSPEEQGLDCLLAGLLRQLIEQRPSVPENIKTLYRYYQRKKTRPSTDEIRRVLHSVCRECSRVFVIVDGLDECRSSDGAQTRIVDEIFTLQHKYPVSFFATSRFVPEVMAKFENKPALEIRAPKPDVMRHLNANLDKLPSFVARNQLLQDEIIESITDAADGMFLLAQLHLESLVDKRSPDAIRSTLKKLVAGPTSYDAAYHAAMERINRQADEHREMAKKVLSWITCATRQLTRTELQTALTIEPGQANFNPDNIPEIDDIVSVCAGLVTLDEHSDIIRLVHHTAREYFLRSWAEWFPRAHYDIATSCVTYLASDVFADGPCRDEQEFEQRLHSYPMYSYTARNWGYHAKLQNIETELVLGLLDDKRKVDACAQGMNLQQHPPSTSASQQIPRDLSGLHLAAFFGLETVTEHLIRRGDAIDLKDSLGGTPLRWAVRGCQESTVRLLLENGANPNDTDGDGRMLLSLAIAENNDEIGVVGLLLKNGAHLETPDRDGQTPLSLAASSDHRKKVQLLLENGADIESRDKYGRTPLSRAALSGHSQMVELLLDKGADIETQDRYGQTALSRAAFSGHKEMVMLLLDRGACLETVDKDSRTPLARAALSGHEDMIRLLLDRGADPGAKDKYCKTAVSIAAAEGHVSVTKLLGGFKKSVR